LEEKELGSLQKRLKALICVTFFHITTMQSCVLSDELFLRSQVLIHVEKRKKNGINKMNQQKLNQILLQFGAEIILDDEKNPQESSFSQKTKDFLQELQKKQLQKQQAKEKQQRQLEATQHFFIHLVEEPHRIDAFLSVLQEFSDLKIVETQTCGSLFLDKSNSTLDINTTEKTKKKQEEKIVAIDTTTLTFTRQVANNVQELIEEKMNPVTIRNVTSITTTLTTKEESNKKKKQQHTPPSKAKDFTSIQHHRPPSLSTTFQLHTNEQGYFSKERLRLHARIAHQLYEASPRDIIFPRFVLLIGIPGAGKTTILSHLDSTGQLKLSDFVNFDVDDVIALLPEYYHAMLNLGLGNAHESKIPGPHTRYQMCRDEAKFILKKNLFSAMMCRKNIILHGSGKSLNEYVGIIDQVKAAGFDTHVVCLDIPTEVAYERVEKRSNGYGRNVPRSLIDFSCSLITRNFKRLASRVPNAHLFDTDGIPPRLVWSKQRSSIIKQDPLDPIQMKYNL
jgi:predicted ABC-type ATPase